jgi:hypothetical protein
MSPKPRTKAIKKEDRDRSKSKPRAFSLFDHRSEIMAAVQRGKRTITIKGQLFHIRKQNKTVLYRGQELTHRWIVVSPDQGFAPVASFHAPGSSNTYPYEPRTEG